MRILVETFPRSILPFLEAEGMLMNKEYTDVFVNDYLEEFSQNFPAVIRYFLTIPRFNPTYNFNIVARTLIKNNHVEALQELLRNSRTKLGIGTINSILEEKSK
jgi:hypothetical protein